VRSPAPPEDSLPRPLQSALDPPDQFVIPSASHGCLLRQSCGGSSFVLHGARFSFLSFGCSVGAYGGFDGDFGTSNGDFGRSGGDFRSSNGGYGPSNGDFGRSVGAYGPSVGDFGRCNGAYGTSDGGVGRSVWPLRWSKVAISGSETGILP
jgi:hypothetical protein